MTGENGRSGLPGRSGGRETDLYKRRTGFEGSRKGVLFQNRGRLLDADLGAEALFRVPSDEAPIACRPSDPFRPSLPSCQPSQKTVQGRVGEVGRGGQCLFEGPSRTLEEEVFTPKGALNRIVPLGFPNREARVWAITEGQEAEWSQCQRADEVVALVQVISTKLVGAQFEAMDPAIEAALARIGVTAEADQCQVFRLLEGGQVIRKTYEWHAEGKASRTLLKERQGLPRAHFSWLLDRLDANEVVQIGSLEEVPDPDFRGALAEEGRQSILFVPLWLEGAPTGFLEVSTVGRERTWSASDQHLLRFAADTLSSALGRWDLDAELRYKAYHDPLTGHFNRRALQETLAREVARFQRYRTPFSLLMFDLDHFKAVNDRHGHEMGDKVLKQVARLAREALREPDVVGRWGGEEFLVLLPDTDAGKARVVADRLGQGIAEAHFEGPGQVTASLGLATLREGESQDQLLRRVDEALYRAKEGGRDRVEQARLEPSWASNRPW